MELKVVPLKTNRKVLTWFCLCPADETTSKWMKFRNIAFTFITITPLTFMFITSIMYFVRYFKTDRAESLYGFFQIGGTLSLLYGFWAVLFSRDKMKAIFDHLNEIYQTSKESFSLKIPFWTHFQWFFSSILASEDLSEDAFRFLLTANDTSEWIWRAFSKLMFYALISIPIASGGSVVLCYMLRDNFDVNYLYHPFKLM